MAIPNSSFGTERVAQMYRRAQKLWFIGIGGIHMCSLAAAAKAEGYEVGGSDRTAGENTARLRAMGVPVYIGHAPEQAAQADMVIYTLAIEKTDPEYTAAMAMGVPCVSRAEFLAVLLLSRPCRIGVAGSHGKSTVTALLGELFYGAGHDPLVFCGAQMRAFDAPAHLGKGKVAVFEACEYENSFLLLPPTVSVLLNAALDHVDFFEDERAICASFERFAALPASCGGVALVNADDENAMRATEHLPCRRVTFGMKNADYQGTIAHMENGFATLHIRTPEGEVFTSPLHIPGGHHAANALAAAAAAHLTGLSCEQIAKGLSQFRGARRRMEYRGIFCGARVYDDYAHHPAEIAATLQAARLMLSHGGRLFAVFQSHTYSRTAAFLTEIGAALRLADCVYVADIYAAREKDTLGMSGARIAEEAGENAFYVGGTAEITKALREKLAPNDLLVVMGAGDIAGIFRDFFGKDFTL